MSLPSPGMVSREHARVAHHGEPARLVLRPLRVVDDEVHEFVHRGEEQKVHAFDDAQRGVGRRVVEPVADAQGGPRAHDLKEALAHLVRDRSGGKRRGKG